MEDTLVIAASLGELVELWIELIDARATYYDAEAGFWQWEPARIPSERHALVL